MPVVKKARSLAVKLRENYGTGDPFSICEQMGIHVIWSDLPKKVNGFYLKTLYEGERHRMIFLRCGMDRAQERVVCAHELGHALLHANTNAIYLSTQTYLNGGRYEREADLFCAYLLLGEEDLEGSGGDAVTVEEIARRAGLPERLVRMRLGMDA